MSSPASRASRQCGGGGASISGRLLVRHDDGAAGDLPLADELEDEPRGAARRELAERLERAGRQLDGALYDARKRVDQRDAERQVADREREIAERLKEKAKAVREAQREARLAALPRHRRMQNRNPE